MPSMAQEEPERATYLDWRKREVAHESPLVEEHGAMVLGDHMEALRHVSVSDETRLFHSKNSSATDH